MEGGCGVVSCPDHKRCGLGTRLGVVCPVSWAGCMLSELSRIVKDEKEHLI